MVGRPLENVQIGVAGIAGPAERIEEGGTLDAGLDCLRARAVRSSPATVRRSSSASPLLSWASRGGQRARATVTARHRPRRQPARRRSVASRSAAPAQTRNADTCKASMNASISACVVR